MRCYYYRYLHIYNNLIYFNHNFTSLKSSLIFFLNPDPSICLLNLEREEGKERERERNINVGNINQLPPVHAPSGDPSHNLGMCSDWGLNLQSFGVQDDAPTN